MGNWNRFKKRFYLDPAVKRFIAFNKAKWKRDPNVVKSSVVLVDIFDWNPLIYCFSHVINHLANLTGSSIESFNLAGGLSNKLGLPLTRYERIYESFGAKLKLRKTFWKGLRHRRASLILSNSLFQNLKSKQDVLDIDIEGVKIGRMLYDTYLRRLKAPYVDIRDKRLRDLLYETCLLYNLIKDYFDQKDVRAVLTSHANYTEYGMLAHFASKRGVPVFMLLDCDEFRLLEINIENDFQIRPYWMYKKVFSELPETDKSKYLMESEVTLESRLSGKLDKGIRYILAEGMPILSGYGSYSKSRLLKDTGRPRVLILLNCFLDAPHIYRDLLFTDMWDWLDFLLTHASETEFDWYVKPHPSGLPTNDEVVNTFRAKFPKINFLDRTASNSQLMEEGISAMFTTYGTAGHEFAYKGVPVVFAGDNPHVSYDFNIHAKNREEYLQYIKNAGTLKLKIDQNEVLEFFSMHYLHSYRSNEFGARIISEKNSYLKLGYSANEPAIFDRYIEDENEAQNLRIKAYCESFFSAFLKTHQVTKIEKF